MEIFDVVNENDEVIGTATREECHSDSSLIHRAVHFALFDKKNRKVLLTQRSFKKETDPGKLTFLGEHVVADEGYRETAKRGVSEELGFVPKSVQEVQHNIFRLHGQTEFVRFFIVDWNGEKIKIDKEEVIDIKWMSPELLVKQKSNYSEMTRYWVENIDWDNIFPKK